MTDRRARMLGDIVLADSLGMEIGPLHAPLVRRAEGRILYVDYASAETLRANFRHPGDPADIVDVDIIWGDRPLRDCVGEPVDYIVASHVIEHVPDLIGWLLELHQALKPGGTVGLAIPDRRFTFDIRRPVSLPGEMMEAYLQRHRRPSLRQVFDAAAMSKDLPEPETWRPGEATGGLPAEVLARLAPAGDLVRRVFETGQYIDAHCWIFTPASFLDTAQALHAMGNFPFVIEGFFPTEPGAIEFLVRLRAVADPADAAISRAIAGWRTPPAEPEALHEMPDQALRDRIATLEAECDRLNAAIGEIRASHSWRMTAPLRAAMHLFRGPASDPAHAGGKR